MNESKIFLNNLCFPLVPALEIRLTAEVPDILKTKIYK